MPPRLCPPTACGLWKSRLLLLGLWKSRARFPDPESRRPRCAADARCNQLSPQGHRARESAHAARGLFRCLVQALTFPSHGLWRPREPRARRQDEALCAAHPASGVQAMRFAAVARRASQARLADTRGEHGEDMANSAQFSAQAALRCQRLPPRLRSA